MRRLKFIPMLLLLLSGNAGASYILDLPGSVGDPTSPVGATIDGTLQRVLWDPAELPIPYHVNAVDPTPATPLIVAPNRDPEREFRIAVIRAFEHWGSNEIDTTFLETEFRGETTLAPGPVDGVNVIGFGPCPPGVLAFNNEITFGVLASVPGSAFSVFSAPNPPIEFDFFGRTVHTGQMVEGDTTMCADVPWSTTLGDGITTPGTFDLESTTTHEEGHFLGIGHSGVLASTMFPAADVLEGDGNDGAGATLAVDDVLAISTAYPNERFDGDQVLRGRAVIGTLFPGLPGSVPFIGPVPQPGDGAMGVHVVAVDPDGIVQSATVSDLNGSFALAGVRGGGRPFLLEMDSLNGPLTIAGLLFQYSPALSPLAFFSHQTFTGNAGDFLEFPVFNALPSRGDGIGIGNIVPQSANLTAIGYIRDNPATPGIDISGETAIGGIVVSRGEQIGGVVPTPVPIVFQGDLFVFNAGLGGGAAIVSIDLGPGIQVTRPPATTGGFYVFSAKVDAKARRGPRNVAIVDALGRRAILPGAITVD